MTHIFRKVTVIFLLVMALSSQASQWTVATRDMTNTVPHIVCKVADEVIGLQDLGALSNLRFVSDKGYQDAVPWSVYEKIEQAEIKPKFLVDNRHYRTLYASEMYGGVLDAAYGGDEQVRLLADCDCCPAIGQSNTLIIDLNVFTLSYDWRGLISR